MLIMPSKAIKKYLSVYAEIESMKVDKTNHVYDYVIVIPVYNENPDCLGVIFSNIINTNVLIIVVVNSPDNKHICEANCLFIRQLTEKSNLQYDIHTNCRLLKFSDSNDIVLVDRNSKGLQLPAESGVGLARKIGCDIALKYFTEGNIKYPWIFSTDADVILPVNYFSQFQNGLSIFSAVVLDFQHVSDEQHLNSIQYLYDFKLRYYHAGIMYAGTAYDYIPLGSTLIVSMECYGQVRGFPKKNAGEDFYLLNKLAKIKPIKYCLEDSTVKITSRISDRVPFGTGPALAKINALNNINEYTYYSPQCFIFLQKWLCFLKNMWCDDKLQIIAPADEKLSALFLFLNCEKVFLKCSAQIKSKSHWQKFIHQWFDAFKTLKTVHFFDKKFTRLNYLQLLNEDSFAKVSSLKLKKMITRHDKDKSCFNSLLD